MGLEEQTVQNGERVKEVSEGEISRKTYAMVRLSDGFDHVKNSVMFYVLGLHF